MMVGNKTKADNCFEGLKTGYLHIIQCSCLLSLESVYKDLGYVMASLTNLCLLSNSNNNNNNKLDHSEGLWQNHLSRYKPVLVFAVICFSLKMHIMFK